jgi:N-acetylmuramoyl-L-alanine amidase
MLIVALLSAGFMAENVQAASGLKIYNYTTKKESTYTGKQIKTTLNGVSIGKSDTPGILVNGVALLPYNDIFEKTAIDADCIYNKEKGTISISKNNKTIQMTIGSTKATVNGKQVTMSVAPMRVKYVNAEIIKILVPSRFVSETLGLGYTWFSDKSTVAIVKHSLQLSYNSGNKFEYTGIQGAVSIDNKNIDLGNMPSIITNNTAMLRAKKVFANSSIGANYSYNKTDKKITLTKGETVLTMTVGSTVAHLNGKPMVLDTAPIVVTNHDVETSYVMVPGGFTAACFGYDYTWNSAKRTSMIVTQKADNPAEGGSNTDPEMGDIGVITEPGTILGQWFGDSSLYGKSNGVQVLDGGSSNNANPGLISTVTRDYTNVKQNAETFMIIGSTPFGKVSSKKSGKEVSIQASNMYCTDYTYQMSGVSSNFVKSIGITNDASSNSTKIKLDSMMEDYTYNLSLSADRKILYVTVYQNSLMSVVVGTNTIGDYITIGGLSPLKVSVSEQAGFVYIDLPYTTNGLGNLFTNINGAKYMNMIYNIASSEKTQLVVGINSGYERYVSENGNQFTILFQKPGSTHTPTPPPTEEPETPEETDDIDQNDYEIVIPKPEGITRSMITDEDDYFNHRFTIMLPGDYTGFFDTHSISKKSNVIQGVSVSYNNNRTVIGFATTRLQGYEIAMDSKNIYINIDEPKNIYKNIVVLDPGHGGGANGAQYFGTREKDINFKILYTIGKKYFNQDPSKLKVYYTRIKDVDMSLSDRAGFAKKYGADLFVSLHMNASTASSAYGTEVYYASNNEAKLRGLNSKGLATLFVNNITKELGTSNRGAKAERYTVVYKNTVPAVLIELGFLSNTKDHSKITNATFQDNAAKTIYDTLLEVFEEYPTGR